MSITMQEFQEISEEKHKIKKFYKEQHTKLEKIRLIIEKECSHIKTVIDSELKKRGHKEFPEESIIYEIVGEILSKEFLIKNIIDIKRIDELSKQSLQFSGGMYSHSFSKEDSSNITTIRQREITNAILRINSREQKLKKAGVGNGEQSAGEDRG